MLFVWRFIHIEMQIWRLSNQSERVNSWIAATRISHSRVPPQSRVHSGGTAPSLLVGAFPPLEAQGCEEDTRCTCDGTLVYGRKFVNGDMRATAAEAMEMGCLHKSVSGAIECSNGEMGGDPAFGIAKFCYCLAGMDVVRCVRIGYCCAVT